MHKVMEANQVMKSEIFRSLPQLRTSEQALAIDRELGGDNSCDR